VALRLATSADLPAIMEIERLPGFETLVGRSSQSIHQALMADPAHAYLVDIADDGAISGFAILRDIGNPQGGVYLKRIAIRTPGQGYGSTLLAAVIDWVFALGDAHRFHLDHFSDNQRAHRAYEKCGLRQEGVLRQAYRLPDGRFADLTVMAILRPEWQANRRQAAEAARLAALTPLQHKLRAKGLDAVAELRRQLFAPLGSDIVPVASSTRIAALWDAVTQLHASAATEVGSIQRGGDESASTLIRALAREIDNSEPVDLVFSHSISSPGRFVTWHEQFAGAVECDFAGAIAMIDTLEQAQSPICQDDIVIAARDGGWAIWIDPDAVTRTRPGR